MVVSDAVNPCRQDNLDGIAHQERPHQDTPQGLNEHLSTDTVLRMFWMVAMGRPDASLSCGNESPAAHAASSSWYRLQTYFPDNVLRGQVFIAKFMKVTNGLGVDDPGCLRVHVRQVD